VATRLFFRQDACCCGNPKTLAAARAARHQGGMTEIDARNLLCPLPVLRARKALLALAPGVRLAITTTDPMAVIDLPHFCVEQGHRLIDMQETAGETRFVIERG
jgi:tRNA 2-thiouridine synthesizing protein A